jgi:hypothetical protein
VISRVHFTSLSWSWSRATRREEQSLKLEEVARLLGDVFQNLNCCQDPRSVIEVQVLDFRTDLGLFLPRILRGISVLSFVSSSLLSLAFACCIYDYGIISFTFRGVKGNMENTISI